jgi:excinuclease UvrABC nuclease subunit
MVISESLTPEEQAEGRTFPHIRRIRDVTKAVAKVGGKEGGKVGDVNRALIAVVDCGGSQSKSVVVVKDSRNNRRRAGRVD